MPTDATPLIPRRAFFSNPDRASVQLSPDGNRIAWLAPLDGVQNVWVAPRADPAAAQPVTRDAGRGIRAYFWAHTSSHILYIQDYNGDENWRIYLVDMATGTTRNLTPFDGVQARIEHVSHKHPTEIAVSLNNRDQRWHDVYRLNLLTGELTLLVQHDRFIGFVVDDDYHVRFALLVKPDSGIDILAPSSGDWIPWETVPPEDAMTTEIVGLDKSEQRLYLRDSRGRDTAALVETDPATHASRVIAVDPCSDVANIMLHPTEKTVQAASFIYERKRWQIVDPALVADFTYLGTVADGDVEIVSRTLDDRMWIILVVLDDSPSSYYLYDRDAGAARFLFTNRQALADLPLAKMHPAVIKSRDGLDLIVYCTLPHSSDSNGDGIPDHPLPMVLTPHGGPWGRDVWGFNTIHQWLANRGYAVLAVNFRASSGLGKSFLNAGNLQWGEGIVNDQQDAVAWAVAQGIANPQRIGVMGGSFGGYSTLAGLTFTPEVFACGVDLFGPVNLITLLESIPPYWQAMVETFATRVGDLRTDAGRALLKRHSPLTYADRICRPLLIGQGANDARVKQAESDQIVDVLQERGIPVTYALYPDEGHGFARPENNLSFNALAEAFLAQHLGGRVEPIGDNLAGSSVQVLTGMDGVPGLDKALLGQP